MNLNELITAMAILEERGELDKLDEIGQELFLETVSGIVSSPVTARGNCIGKHKDCYSYRSWRRTQSIPSASLRPFGARSSS